MRRLVATVSVLALAAGVGVTHERVRRQRAEFPRDEDLYYLPAARQLEVASLGYREVLADLIWIRALLLIADVRRGQDHEWIIRYLDAITTLSPKFRRAYVWGGVAFVYTGEDLSRDMIDRAVAVYRQGLEHYPEDHELLFGAGMMLLRDVSTTDGYTEAEVAASKREGAALLRKAAAFGAPPVVRQYAATLVSDPATGDEMALSFLESQYLETDDEDYRRLLERKIAELADEGRLARLDEIRGAFLRERNATFPYLPDTTYALIRAE